jgi:YHS domain-containing protein
MRKILTLTVILAVFSVGTLMAKEGKAQTNCPICKMKINKELYADYKGERVYFGCNACPEEFRKNPEKYVKQLKDSGVVLEKTSTDRQEHKHGKMMNKEKMSHMKCNMKNFDCTMNKDNCKMMKKGEKIDVDCKMKKSNCCNKMKNKAMCKKANDKTQSAGVVK